MSLSKPEEQLAHELSCPICLQLFSDPVVLPCGHNYCWACIRKTADRTDKAPHCCPECREEYQAPAARNEKSVEHKSQNVPPVFAGGFLQAAGDRESPSEDGSGAGSIRGYRGQTGRQGGDCHGVYGCTGGQVKATHAPKQVH
uniref:RING-type domain-containing protein n=1 Tax=Cyclopterus lumpus TaxID=8103 RepID=A0A8C2WBI6_CYCLU